MSQSTKADRGKINVEVTFKARQQLRLLAALTGMKMSEAAADAISRRLAEVQGQEASEDDGPVSRGGYPVGP